MWALLLVRSQNSASSPSVSAPDVFGMTQCLSAKNNSLDFVKDIVQCPRQLTSGTSFLTRTAPEGEAAEVQTQPGAPCKQGVQPREVTRESALAERHLGKGRASRFHFARGFVSVNVKNVATRKILASFVESRKEGSGSLAEAERTAIRKLARKVTSRIGARIDETMTGGWTLATERSPGTPRTGQRARRALP